MAYQEGVVPPEYDPAFFQEQLAQIAQELRLYQAERIRLIPQPVAPDRPQEGDVANADGTNWNPGGGAGLYQYLGGAWVKM